MLPSLCDISHRVGDVLPVHGGLAVYEALLKPQDRSAPTAQHGMQPTGPGLLGSRTEGPPRQSICALPTTRHDGGVPDRFPSQDPAPFRISEYVVCTAAPRCRARLPRQRMCVKSHARPLSARRSYPVTPVTHQPVWGDTKGTQHREMAADNRPLVSP